MKKLILIIAITIGFNSASDAQKHVRSGIQANVGIASALGRWDKNFDQLSFFFTDIGSLSVQPGLRLYTKPQYNYSLNYIRNLQYKYTWKGGLFMNSTQIERNDGFSYRDTTSINISELGVQLAFVKVFHPAQGNEILLQIGASAANLSLKNNQLISKVDTTDLFGFANLMQESNLKMEAVSPWLIQGIARVEWFSRLNEKWSVSASIEGRLPFTMNTRFSGETKVDVPIIPQFPITFKTNTNTPSFSMPYWSCSLGLVRIIEWKKSLVKSPLGAI
jgi:hypothetical protein